MPSQIGIFVNGWAVRLNRTPNVVRMAKLFASDKWVPCSGGLGVGSTGWSSDTYRTHLPLSLGARCGGSCRVHNCTVCCSISQRRAGSATSMPSANVLLARSRAHSVWTWDAKKLLDGQCSPFSEPAGSTSRPCWYGRLSAGPVVFH
jgi:hypothetical protein